MTENLRPDDHLSDSFEQRLSLWLDGKLDAATKLQFENELEASADASRSMTAWKSNRDNLRCIYRDTSAGLPSSFADRVVDAAIDRARDEGLGDEHPLILAADHPSKITADHSTHWVSGRNFRRTAAVAALAASLGGLIFLRGRPSNIENGLPAGGLVKVPIEVAADLVIAGDSNVVADSNIASGLVSDSLAGVAAKSKAGETGLSGDGDELDEGLGSRTTEDLKVAMTDAISVDDVEENVAIGSNRGDSDLKIPDATTFAGAVMVFEVVCVDDARRDMVLADAMRTAGLQLEAQQEMTNGLVTAATEASGIDSGSDFQILYLSASARRIDRLYLELLRDSANVRGVGLSLALSAPIVDAANALGRARGDAATSKQNDAAFPVSLRGDREALLNDLNELTFLPMSPGGGLVGGSYGGDEVAQAILILR